MLPRHAMSQCKQLIKDHGESKCKDRNAKFKDGKTSTVCQV